MKRRSRVTFSAILYRTSSIFMHVGSQSCPKRMTTTRSSSERMAWSTCQPLCKCGSMYDILATEPASVREGLGGRASSGSVTARGAAPPKPAPRPGHPPRTRLPASPAPRPGPRTHLAALPPGPAPRRVRTHLRRHTASRAAVPRAWTRADVCVRAPAVRASAVRASAVRVRARGREEVQVPWSSPVVAAPVRSPTRRPGPAPYQTCYLSRQGVGDRTSPRCHCDRGGGGAEQRTPRAP